MSRFSIAAYDDSFTIETCVQYPMFVYKCFKDIFSYSSYTCVVYIASDKGNNKEDHSVIKLTKFIL